MTTREQNFIFERENLPYNEQGKIHRQFSGNNVSFDQHQADFKAKESIENDLIENHYRYEQLKEQHAAFDAGEIETE